MGMEITIILYVCMFVSIHTYIYVCAFKIFILHLSTLHVCGAGYHRAHGEVRGQCAKLGFLLLLCGSQGLTSSHQA